MVVLRRSKRGGDHHLPHQSKVGIFNGVDSMNLPLTVEKFNSKDNNNNNNNKDGLNQVNGNISPRKEVVNDDSRVMVVSRVEKFPSIVTPKGHGSFHSMDESSSPLREANGRVGWRKILYVRQPFPDNYVDHNHFLAELKKNTTVQLYEYSWLVRKALTVVQHISGVLGFVAFFVFVWRGQVGPTALILLANGMTVVFYLLWVFHVWGATPAHRSAGKQAGKSAVLFMMTLLGLTPILKTLTEDTSDDTVWALTTICLLVHVCFFDYSTVEARGRDSVALNAAIFSAVLLASRLPSKAHVFGFMSLAVSWFACIPFLRRILRGKNEKADLILSVIIIIAVGFMLVPIWWILSIIYVFAMVIMLIICPAFFTFLQRYKHEIRGPWDEASVRLSSRL